MNTVTSVTLAIAIQQRGQWVEMFKSVYPCGTKDKRFEPHATAQTRANMNNQERGNVATGKRSNHSPGPKSTPKR
eukprot:2594333-Amphidinium_carterae.1